MHLFLGFIAFGILVTAATLSSLMRLTPLAVRPVGGMLLSTGSNSVERAVAAQEAGADYLGVGPVFPTRTKKDAGDAIGWEGLRLVAEAVSIPVAAIGGLNETNIGRVRTEMASVVSALADLEKEAEMEERTRALIEELDSRP